MSQPLLIDSLVNLFGFLGLVATILALRGRGSSWPMRLRWSFGLGLVAALYLSRGLYWVTGARLFDVLTIGIAILVPLGALVLTEGLIRRHAPLAAKLVVSGGMLLTAAVLLLTTIDAALVLGTLIGVSLVAIGATCAMALRDLSPAERRTIGSLGICLVMLIPAALSDFRTLFPATPARLSPLALLVFVWVGLNSGAMRTQRLITDLAMATSIAGLAGAGLSVTGDHLRLIEAAAVILSAMLFFSIVGLVRRTEGEGMDLRQRLAASPGRNRDQLLLDLAEDPLFGGGSLLGPAQLADHDVPAFQSLLERWPVLRVSEAPWDQSDNDIVVESARALFAAHGATHLLLVEEQPLTLLALHCPSIAAGSGVEADISVAQQLISLTSPEDRPHD